MAKEEIIRFVGNLDCYIGVSWMTCDTPQYFDFTVLKSYEICF